jgi:pimeloyl-ACP methyl ester carboxylesterase
MKKVRSRDGTGIAFDRSGEGPPIILVLGAFNDRQTGAPLAKALEAHFTVYNYDRRGRGASEDTTPFAVEREIEDIDALIADPGGSAPVFGYSSGAILAMRAVERGLAITKLALYEPPFMMDAQPTTLDHASRINELVAAGRRGEAVEYYQRDVVGIPAEIVAQLRDAPFRPALETIAHTLAYDASLLVTPPEVVHSVTVPTLVLAGDSSLGGLLDASQRLADALPQARHRTLDGQTHDIVPDVVAPVLEEFLSASSQPRG